MVLLKRQVTILERKIQSVGGLDTNAALTAVENEIPSVSDLVKKRDYDTKITEIGKKLIIIMTSILQLQSLIL